MKKSDEQFKVIEEIKRNSEWYFNKVDFTKSKETKELMDYLLSLKESESKTIVTNAIAQYQISDQTENRFKNSFVIPLLEHIDDPLIQCIMGELQEVFKTSNREYFRRLAAKNGNEYSQYMLGEECKLCELIEEAILWLQKSANKGFVKAYAPLAQIYQKHVNVKNLVKAKKLLVAGAKQNDVLCQRRLGELYQIEENKKMMVKYYKLAANNNDCYAQCYLGAYYHRQEKLDEALYWHTMAANNNLYQPFEMDNEFLSRIYGNLTDESHLHESDCGCFVSVIQIRYPFTRLISRFYLAEQHRLNGDYQNAITNYKMVGSDYAYKRIASIYQLLGDYQNAVFYYEKLGNSSDQVFGSEGSLEAGKIYFNVIKDIDKALYWYKQSAILGSFESAMFLGDYYTDKEDDLAIYWYSRFTRELRPNDLLEGCLINKDAQKAAVANGRLAKLLTKLGYEHMAKYYYYCTQAGMKDKEYASYIQRIKAYEDQVHKNLFSL